MEDCPRGHPFIPACLQCTIEKLEQLTRERDEALRLLEQALRGTAREAPRGGEAG